VHFRRSRGLERLQLKWLAAEAEQTLADFSHKLRDRVDLDSLNAELVDVVTRTMQPGHVSVWLKTSSS
jgi:hypothetical protein